MPIHEADIPQDDQTGSTEAARVKSTVTIDVKINGAQFKWPVQSFLLEQQMSEHHVLRVNFSYDIESGDESTIMAKSAEFHDKIGASINFTVSSSEQYLSGIGTPLEFAGIITNIYVRSSAARLILVEVEAKSPTVKADVAREFRAFKEVKRLDVINRLLEAYPIEKGTIECPNDTGKAEHVMQWNQTDWDVICHYMGMTESFVYYDGKKLCIEKAKSKNQVELHWLKNVGNVEVRMNVQQMKYKSFGWDVQRKAEVLGEHRPATSFTGLAARVLSGSNQTFTQTDYSISQTLMGSVDSKMQAAADGNEAVSDLVRFHLQTNVPSIKVGDTVKLDGMGPSYNGVYFVTRVQHVVDNGSDYHNQIVGIPLESAKPESYPSRYQTKRSDPIPAIVVDNKDPEKRGRLRVKFPQAVTPDGYPLESGWIRTISGYGGRGRGIYFIPEVDDEVLVMFEYGDPNHGYVIGSLWNGKDKPNGSVYHDDNNYNVIYSRSGHQIILDDTAGEESISIIDKTGKNYIKIGSKDNLIEIVSDKDIVLKSKENIEIEAGKDLKVTTKQGNMTFDAKMNFDVKSMAMSVDAKQSASIKANGNVDLDGGMVNVNGKGNVAVKGNPIMLN